MRFFELFNLQDVVLFLVPTVVFVILFGMALGYAHFRSREPERGKERPYYTFHDGVEDRRSPFPLALTLIIAGTVIWGLLYIFFVGFLGVRI